MLYVIFFCSRSESTKEKSVFPLIINRMFITPIQHPLGYSFNYECVSTKIRVKMEKPFSLFCPHHTIQHAGSLFPDQGLNLCPLQWKHGILITTTREIPIWGLLSGLQGNEMSHLPGLTRQSPESSSTSPEIFSTLYYEYSAKELPGKRKDVLIVTEIKFSIYSSVCKRQGKLCIKCLP